MTSHCCHHCGTEIVLGTGRRKCPGCCHDAFMPLTLCQCDRCRQVRNLNQSAARESNRARPRLLVATA